MHVDLLGVRSVEIYTGWSRGDLALGLEESGLEVDDVVAQLVVLGLERFVELA